MTNREIKLELAKVALARCSYTDENAFNNAISNLYNWIAEEPEVDVEKPKTDYDNTSIYEIIKYLSNSDRYSNHRYATSLEIVFSANKINTIGDLLRLGKRKFLMIKGVGKGSVTRIDDALEELYGIMNWL